MPTASPRLPSFAKPPVIEVVASVQFEPVPTLDIVHLGLLWQRFRDRFPQVEQKPPLAAVIERLGVKAPLNQGVQFQFSQDMGLPRLWFINQAGDELIQVQADRFIRNWRAMPQVDRPYPRYEEHIRPRFIEDLRLFQRFLSEELKSAIQPNQCELTYINHIAANEHWKQHQDLASVFTGWNSGYAKTIDLPVESIHVRTAHLMNDASGKFLGRLHVALQSAFRSHDKPNEDDHPIFALTLTARGMPTGEGESGVLGFLDEAHSTIVTAFDQMTSKAMHQIWEKRYDS